jgi:putative endonuclease
MNIETRRQANRLGHAAEWRAVWRLRLAGYSILARRYKTKLGEIDIVARRGGVLAFVEVKARGDLETAGFSLRGRQFGRVAAAASLFVARHPHYAAHSLRYDAMLVVGLWPRHLPDVWRAPE